MNNNSYLKIVLVVGLASSTCFTALGSLYFTGASGNYSASASGINTDIGDAPSGGLAYALNFADSGLLISSISVALNISGGNNGDIYAFLSHGDTYSVLLNRIGATSSSPYGSTTSGFSVTLGMTGDDIHLATGSVGQPITGSFAADGRVDYTSSSRDKTLDVFQGTNPQGNWVLHFQDMSGGSVSRLDGFSVDITAVPEPVNVALAVFGVGAVGVGFVRRKMCSEVRERNQE